MQPLLWFFLGKFIEGSPSCFLDLRGACHKSGQMQSGTYGTMIFVFSDFVIFAKMKRKEEEKRKRKGREKEEKRKRKGREKEEERKRKGRGKEEEKEKRKKK
jgi:hypothetical protein